MGFKNASAEVKFQKRRNSPTNFVRKVKAFFAVFFVGVLGTGRKKIRAILSVVDKDDWSGLLRDKAARFVSAVLGNAATSSILAAMSVMGNTLIWAFGAAQILNGISSLLTGQGKAGRQTRKILTELAKVKASQLEEASGADRERLQKEIIDKTLKLTKRFNFLSWGAFAVSMAGGITALAVAISVAPIGPLVGPIAGVALNWLSELAKWVFLSPLFEKRQLEIELSLEILKKISKGESFDSVLADPKWEPAPQESKEWAIKTAQWLNS